MKYIFTLLLVTILGTAKLSAQELKATKKQFMQITTVESVVAADLAVLK